MNKKIGLILCLVVTVVMNSFAAPGRKTIELLAQDSVSGRASVALVYFAPGTSPAYVSSEDVAETIVVNDSVPQLYTLSSDNVALGTNSAGPFVSTTVIPVALNINSAGVYIISCMQFANFDPASMLFFEDRQRGIMVDLRTTPYHVMLPQSGQVPGRFFLHVTFPPNVVSTPAGCHNNDGIITVQEDQSVTWNAVKIYDSASALVAIDTNVSGPLNFNNLPGGTYRVEFDYNLYAPIQYITVDEHQLISTISVSNNHDTVFQNIQFYGQSTNANTYVWDFGDGSTITGVANPTYFYTSPGIYTAKVNCSNQYGCSAHADTVMYIETTTAINQIDGNTVNVITDSKTVRIEMDNALSGHYAFQVYDLDGRAVKQGTINNTTEVINFSNDPTGVYILSIRSATAALNQKVFIAH